MSRYAVLSDVHANLHALTAVLEALEPRAVDAYLVAGDLVGYGSRPNECIDLLRRLPGVVIVAGNHDQVATGRAEVDRCESALARRSLSWTRERLSPESRDYLASLPTVASVGPLVMTHGALADVFEYVLTPPQAVRQLQQLRREHPAAGLLVHGHTHQQWAVAETEGVVSSGRRSVQLRPGQRYLLNPGSVGQSRQRSPKARFLVLDMASGQVAFSSVRYDLQACRADLRRHGLPEGSCHRPPPLASLARRAVRSGLTRLLKR